MSLLSIGTVALDTIETPFGSAEGILGGSAVYLSLAARYFCEEVQLIAVVGADFPEDYTDLLVRSGIDLEGLVVDPTGATFSWAGRYHLNMNDRDTLATHLNVLASFDPRVPERYKDAAVVCLGNLDPTIQLHVLDQMTAPEFVVCDTMNYWIERTPDALREVLKRIDCLIINDAEARELSGEPNLIAAAEIIQQMGPRHLVIKKGEHGAMMFFGTEVFTVPAVPLKVIADPTGAGDTFAGGFAGYLARERVYDFDHLRAAMVYGTILASFSVEQFGPGRLYHLVEDEISDRVALFQDITRLPAADIFSKALSCR